MNLKQAQEVILELGKHGVAEWMVVPGSRNSPLVTMLNHARGLRLWRHFEERSAGFFALGRARATSRPVAVLTTSGTAAAELLPAAIESSYTGTPLVMVTADRPQSYRGSGAPQSIEQEGLFGCYAHRDLSTWKGDAPLHLNIPFNEPLIDGEARDFSVTVTKKSLPIENIDLSPLECFLRETKHPLVILGALHPEDRQAALSFARRLGTPVYAEAISGLREAEVLREQLLFSGEEMLMHLHIDGILRVGGVPTLRFWRDLEKKEIPVFSVSRTPFRGMARNHTLLQLPSLQPLGDLFVVSTPRHESLFFQDRKRAQTLEHLLACEPCSEPGMLHQLSTFIPSNALVSLGNSLPIREWDLAATHNIPHANVVASRGANGIDGQLSTFFGMCGEGRENWAIVGDLTALYDLASLWVLPQLQGITLRIVVVNNRGGRIFERMFEDPQFQNRHELSFQKWAEMWGVAYARWDQVLGNVAHGEKQIIELTPDAKATERFWNAWSSITKGDLL